MSNNFLLVIIFVFSSHLAWGHLSIFKPTYTESRAQFLQILADLETAQKFTIKQQQFYDPMDPQFVTDVALLRAADQAKNLIVVISGVHGIEGFVGSAIQASLLKKLNATATTDYLFVHALNPYGFVNFRRVDRNNVDLNRNFVNSEREFLTANPQYSQINTFLNPETAADLNLLSKPLFVLSAVKLILQNSIDSLRRSILIGQYQQPKGLYFGGSAFQYQKSIIDTLYKNTVAPYSQVFIMDIHTGYGERNKLHILANSSEHPSAPYLKKIFPVTRLDFGDQNKFYKVTGDLIGYIEAKARPEQTIFGAVFELGTIGSQTTIGAIESLRRMILENQKFHFGAAPESKVKINSLFTELFYPQDQLWQSHALNATAEEFLKLETYFSNLPR